MNRKLVIVIPFIIASLMVYSILTTFAKPSSQPATVTVTTNQTLLNRIGGPVWSVAKQGNVTYLGIGHRLETVDVQDPANPVRLGQSEELTIPLRSLVLTGTYGYAPGRFGFYIFDLSQPAQPAIADFYNLPSERINDIVISGTVAFIAESKNSGAASGSGGLRILDISDPQNPSQIGHYNDGDTFYAVAPNGSNAYVETCQYNNPTSCSPGFAILDISNLSSPSEIQFYNMLSGYYYDLVINGNVLYRNNIDAGKIEIFNLDNPAAPAFANEISQSARKLKLHGQRLFASSFYGMYVLDVSQPVTPTLYGHFLRSQFFGPWDMAADDDYAYVAYGDGGMKIVDLSQPSLPQTGQHDIIGNPTDLTQVGNYIYLTDGPEVKVLDITSPLTPTIVVTHTANPAQPYNIQLEGNDVFLSGLNGFEIVNVSNPVSPTHRSSYHPQGNWLADSIIRGSYIYLAMDDGYNDNLEIVDISDRDNPVLAASTGSLYRRGTGLAINGNYLFLAENSNGSSVDSSLTIVDITNPVQPQIIVSHTITGPLETLAMVNDYVYLGGQGLRIVDVSDPLNPVDSGTYRISGDAGYDYKVAAKDGQLYVSAPLANGETAQEILDISNPATPVKVGDYEYLNGQAISVDGNWYEYAARKERGLYIYSATGTNVYLPIIVR